MTIRTKIIYRLIQPRCIFSDQTYYWYLKELPHTLFRDNNYGLFPQLFSLVSDIMINKSENCWKSDSVAGEKNWYYWKSEKSEMVKTSRRPPCKFLADTFSKGYLTGWPRDVFKISNFRLSIMSFFLSCNRITLAAILALDNYDVTNQREQLQV